MIILVIGLLCAVIYRQTINKYELKISQYNDTISQYQQDIKSCQDNINSLNSQVSDLSNNLSSLGAEMQNVSDSVDTINTSADSNNGKTINIVQTAAKVSPSVIGIKVDVPAQNVNSFWQTQPLGDQGSGIILTADGYIVTNFHVVSYVTQYQNTVITVVLDDGSEHVATYIGGDEINDLAIIKIDAQNLPVATLGSSDNSKVGDFVIAIGNPLGVDLYGSVTFGIISGVNRKIDAENVADKLIQTDAAINPGNSGGALLNMNGEVIGINTIKINQSNVEGIGFAIPIDYAKPLIDSIIQYGYVKDRPTLGLNGSDVTNTMSRMYNIPTGVLVDTVDQGSGAETAGIQINDIVTKVDGQTVSTLSDISNIVKIHKIGDKITVTIYRYQTGNYSDIPVTLTEQK